MFDWSAYLDLAEELRARAGDEAAEQTAISRAYYAHFQPGSIKVAAGDRVVAGQPLGLLGNTGNTTAPHLHFGLLDDPDAFVGTSLPVAFDHWTLRGAIDPAAYFAALSPDPASPPLEPAGEPQAQADTLQLNLDVADFG